MAEKTRTEDRRANEADSAGALTADANESRAFTEHASGMETVQLDLESELSWLLQELSLVQEEMLEVLAAKCERIADSNLDGITELQQREESLCHRLKVCHDQRGELLAMAAEEGLPGDTLGSLASSLTSAHRGELTVQVKEVNARMRLLQHRSLTNWVLTQRSMLHLSQLLEIVATGGRLQPTYGRDESSISSGALVDRDA